MQSQREKGEKTQEGWISNGARSVKSSDHHCLFVCCVAEGVSKQKEETERAFNEKSKTVYVPRSS